MGTNETESLAQGPEEGSVFTVQDLQKDNFSFTERNPFLKAGSIVNGFNAFDEVDAFSNILMDSLEARKRQSRLLTSARISINGRVSYEGWRVDIKRAEIAMRPKKFFGKLLNISALMLEDTTPLDHLPSRDNATVQYALFADMQTTGLGIVGRVAKLVTVGTYPTSSYNARIRSVSYSNLKGNNGEQVAEQLHAKSIDTANKLIIDGLRHIYSAGLPSHGKKR